MKSFSKHSRLLRLKNATNASIKFCKQNIGYQKSLLRYSWRRIFFFKTIFNMSIQQKAWCSCSKGAHYFLFIYIFSFIFFPFQPLKCQPFSRHVHPTVKDGGPLVHIPEVLINQRPSDLCCSCTGLSPV